MAAARAAKKAEAIAADTGIATTEGTHVKTIHVSGSQIRAAQSAIAEVGAQLADLGANVNILQGYANPMMQAEDREPAEYEAEVESYLAKLRNAIHVAAFDAAAATLRPIKFFLNNSTDRNFSKVKVIIRVAGDAEARFAKRSDEIATLPEPPRLWGPRPRQLGGMSYNFVGMQQKVSIPSTRLSFSKATIDNGGGFTLTFQSIDVRPRDNFAIDDEEYVLFVQKGITELTATWTASATNVDAIASGTLVIPVEGELVDGVSLVLEQAGRRTVSET